ncbi:MAG: amidohydrolase family protein [Acidimicrobiia bacterium]
MQGDVFIIDSVIHMHDMQDDNIVGDEGRQTANNLHRLSALFSSPQFPLRKSFMGEAMDMAEAYKLLFADAATDMAVAQAVPLLGWWKRGFAPAEAQYRLKEAYPDRVLFCGGVDPIYQGLEGALEEMERQVEEWGSVGFKFYQAHRKGLSWRADDRRLAYPLYERCLELGVTNVQFHKGAPFGTEHVEDLQPNDIQDAAADFPELTFVIHHFGIPYVQETINIAHRFPNVWLALSAWINMYPIAPKECEHMLGKALMFVGADRLMYGSEAFIWPNLQGYIDLFMEFEMPEELQEGYGYPNPTMADKELIMGMNAARLFGVDVERKKRELSVTAPKPDVVGPQ